MIIRTDRDGFVHPRSSEITSRGAYLQRRQWLAGLAAAGVAWASRDAWAQSSQ